MSVDHPQRPGPVRHVLEPEHQHSEPDTSPIGVTMTEARDARWVVVAVVVVAGAAWAWLALGPDRVPGLPGLPASSPADAPEMATALAARGGVRQSEWGATLGWLSGWVATVLAVMAVPALPLLLTFRRLACRRGHAAAPLVACGAAFVGVWVSAGIILMVGGGLARGIVARSDWLTAHPQVLSGSAAILAGVYQFTALKRTCLAACQRPIRAAVTSWRGAVDTATEAALVGARFAAVCVGCSWALMLVPFAVGADVVLVTFVTGVAMSAECVFSRIRALVAAVAVLTVGVGFGLLAGVLPPGFTA